MDTLAGVSEHRILRRTVLVVALATCLAVVGTSVFAWRTVHRPTLDEIPAGGVDVLMVLGPLDPWRVEMAEDLMRQGRARNLVVSTPNMPLDAKYCDQKHPWPVYCFPPDPSTTRGEAQGLRALAEQHGWASFGVITVDFHANRSRFIFRRCLNADVTITGRDDSNYDAVRNFHVAYQLGGYLKELSLGRC